MTDEEYRRALQKRERDLLDEMDRKQSEARELTGQTATEPMERMVNLEERDTLLRESGAEYEELTEVRAALQRLDNGTFGKCIECGKTIPAGRLEAIPWTQYCLEDQEKIERGGGQASRSLTM